MSIQRLLAVTAGSLLLFLTVSCAAETTTAGGQGGSDQSVLCADLDEMSRVLVRAKALNAFSQQGAARNLRSDLDAAFSRVEASAAADGVDIAALEDEVEKLDAFAMRAPVSITMGQFANLLSGQAAVVAKEQSRVAVAAGCMSSG